MPIGEARSGLETDWTAAYSSKEEDGNTRDICDARTFGLSRGPSPLRTIPSGYIAAERKDDRRLGPRTEIGRMAGRGLCR